ncbi:MAG: hypothetical protein V3573_00260 [Desulfovibrionaceae bacterium]
MATLGLLIPGSTAPIVFDKGYKLYDGLGNYRGGYEETAKDMARRIEWQRKTVYQNNNGS